MKTLSPSGGLGLEAPSVGAPGEPSPVAMTDTNGSARSPSADIKPQGRCLPAPSVTRQVRILSWNDYPKQALLAMLPKMANAVPFKNG
jgi:hypothetical protein